MSAEDLKKVVAFVRGHAGCSGVDIAKGCGRIENLATLLDEASSDADDGGYILKEVQGRYYIGPRVDLVDEL